MPRLGGKPKRRGQADARNGILLGVVGVILVGALAAGAYWIRVTAVELDPATNCPTSGPSSVHLIMFDRSDPITGQQAQQVRQEIDRIVLAAEPATRFDIYTFAGDAESRLEPELSICSVLRPEDASEITQNPERIGQRYEERFARVIDREVERLLEASELPSSPILESIRAAAITSFGPLPGATPRSLLLISDMIQHSPSISHYRTEPDFVSLAESADWARLEPDLRGADVRIIYVIRPGAARGGRDIQNRGHQLFWEQAVSASGGRIMSIEPI